MTRPGTEPPSPSNTPPAPRSATIKALLALFALSLAIRLLAWAWVERNHVPPVFDELVYLARSVGYENLLRDNVRGGIFWAETNPRDEERAYSAGGWPPLHPLLMGAAFEVFGRSVITGRGIVLAQSALTTCLVYLLAARMCRRRGAAVAAGVLHAVYPSFVSYSHLLWSETTYICCLVAAAYFAIRAADGPRVAVNAAFAGMALGLCGLTRAAAVPLFLAIPAWLLWKARPLRGAAIASILCTGVAIAVVTPWLWSLWSREGRFFPLATTGGYNFYLENSPWSDQVDRKTALHAEIDEYAHQHNVHKDLAAQRLAIAHISANPGQFVYRCYKRCVALCQPDRFLLRHWTCGFYPPLPDRVVAGIWAGLAFAFFVLMASAVSGLCAGRDAIRHVSLLLLCIVLGVIPNLVTLATTRMSVPFLALLLPAAGIGVANVFAWRQMGRAALLSACTLAGFVALYAPLRNDFRWLPSTISCFYSPLALGFEANVGGLSAESKDRIVFRASQIREPGDLQIELHAPGYSWAQGGSEARIWHPRLEGRTLSLLVISKEKSLESPRLRITSLKTGTTAEISPVSPATWRRWTPTGVVGFEFVWTGERAPLDKEIVDLLQDFGGDRPLTAE